MTDFLRDGWELGHLGGDRLLKRWIEVRSCLDMTDFLRDG